MSLRSSITLWNYIFKEHIGPFVFAISTTTFILLMDKIFDLIDLIIGKGLSIKVVGEIFFLSLPWIVALTIPMAVLVATIMAFGRLSEDNEIIAMKAGGVSILRMIVPILIAAIVLTSIMILFNDKILPEANHRLRTLLIDVNKKRPGLRLEEGLFLDEFDGYSVYVEDVNPVTSELFGVTIYEYGKKNIPRLIKAQKGNLNFYEASSTLVLTLLEGTIEETDKDDPRKFLRSKFFSHQINIQGIDSDLQRSQREYRGDREMNIKMMHEKIAEYTQKEKPIIKDYYQALFQSIHFPLREASTYFPIIKNYIADSLSTEDQKDYSHWINRRSADKLNTLLQARRRFDLQLKSKEKQINRYHVEIQKKYAVPVACIIFVLIGAPLGIAARKGGVGMGAGISLGFFLVYYIFLLGGERLADRGMLSPFIAMWAANILLGILGIYFIIRRMREATFIDWDRFKYLNPNTWIELVTLWTNKRKRKKIEEHPNKIHITIERIRFKFPLLLDSYITKEYLKAFIFNLIAFMIIFLIVDIFERLHRFIDGGASVATVASYYMYKLPWIIVLIIPTSLLLACIFSLGKMGKNRELVVMKAAGISLYKTLAPILLIGFLMSFVVLVMGEFLVPYTNEKMNHIYSVEIRHKTRKAERTRQNVFYRGTYNRMYYIKTYNPKKARMQNILLSYFVDDTTSIRLDAQKGTWKDGQWVFQDGVIRSLNTNTQQEVVFQFNQVELAFLDETPEDFKYRAKGPEEMNFVQLNEYITKIKMSGGDVRKYLVDLYLKFSFPFACFIVVLFGAPLSANSKKSGGALGFGLSLLASFAYWGFLETGRAIGHKGIILGLEVSPLFAAWIGNIVFGCVGLILLIKARK